MKNKISPDEFTLEKINELYGSQDQVSLKNGHFWDLELLKKANDLYLSGHLYPAKYAKTLGFPSAQKMVRVFRESGLRTLDLKETFEVYGAEIKQKMKSTNVDKYGVQNAGQLKPKSQPKYRDKKPKTPSTPKDRQPTKAERLTKSHAQQEAISGVFVNIKAVSPSVRFWLEIFRHWRLSPEERAYVNEELKSWLSPEGTIDDEACHYLRKHLMESVSVEAQDAWDDADRLVTIKNFFPAFVFDKFNIAFERLEVGGFSFNFYVPSKNTVFEITRLSEATENFVDSEYFVRMRRALAKKGIKLVRFLDEDVELKPWIVESMIFHHLGLTPNKIPARKCEIVELSTQEAYDFCEDNHLNGSANAPIRFGLKFEGTLVQVLTFGKHRYPVKVGDRVEKFELIRSCGKTYTVVQGGFQKLIKHFKKLHPGCILESYVDANISNGNSYEIAGNYLGETAADLYYVVDGRKVSRNRMMKIHLHRYFPDFPKRDDPEYKSINSVQFLRDRGIFEYRGSGNLVYSL